MEQEVFLKSCSDNQMAWHQTMIQEKFRKKVGR